MKEMSNKEQEKNNENKQPALEELEEKIASLEKKLAESEEIAKRAQADYVRFKMDMDAYMQRAEAGKEKAELDALVHTAKKLLPVVNQLEQTVQNMPEELADNAWAQGVELAYKKALNELASLRVYPIEAEIGEEPDLTYHVPISTQPTEDKKLQGKIVQVTDTGYVYKGTETEKVILPSKVLVGKAP